MDINDMNFLREEKDAGQEILVAVLEAVQNPEGEVEKAIHAPGVAGACCSMMLAVYGDDIKEENVPFAVEYSQQCFRIGAYMALSIRDANKLLGE